MSNSISVKFRSTDGAVESLKCNGVEFISTPKPLFVMQFRDLTGKPMQLTSGTFKTVEISGDDTKRILRFSNDEIMLRGGSAEVIVEHPCEDELRWSIALHPGTDFIETEWIDFPVLRLKLDDDFHYVSSFAEGTLMDRHGVAVCSDFPDFASYIGYAPKMCLPIYPGPASAQFHEILREGEGLYIGCEDLEDTLKLLNVVPDGDGQCRLIQQQFTQGKNELGYQVCMKAFHGDWQKGAEIQREWLDKTHHRPAQKLEGLLPAWYDKDPLMVIYPVKGDGEDHYEMEPNQFYPYTKALPVVEKYHRILPGVPLMPLLMHWEGTAPWAPPYVWPPYGGEEELQKFTDALHKQGDYLGLYASGIGWTQVSDIDKSYDCRERYQKEHVDREVCVGATGERYSNICNHPLVCQRVGFDLCPSRDFTRKTVCDEVEKCRTHGVDYLQYFDQNCGGAPAVCYSQEHGHPRIPGPWIAKAMREVMDAAVETGGETLAVGCENASANPYTGSCRVNDMRYSNAWMQGKPLPLYAYLYHEYALGFSGNGCGISWTIEIPEYYSRFHFAWHFAVGNMLAIMLSRDSDIHWGWAVSWNVEKPAQDPIRKLLKNLLAWRHGVAKEFLLYGRMDGAAGVECATVPIVRTNLAAGRETQLPLVLSTTWSHNGKRMTLLVNYSEEPQSAKIHFEAPLHNARLLETGKDPVTLADAADYECLVPALDAILILHD